MTGQQDLILVLLTLILCQIISVRIMYSLYDIDCILRIFAILLTNSDANFNILTLEIWSSHWKTREVIKTELMLRHWGRVSLGTAHHQNKGGFNWQCSSGSPYRTLAGVTALPSCWAPLALAASWPFFPRLLFLHWHLVAAARSLDATHTTHFKSLQNLEHHPNRVPMSKAKAEYVNLHVTHTLWVVEARTQGGHFICTLK